MKVLGSGKEGILTISANSEVRPPTRNFSFALLTNQFVTFRITQTGTNSSGTHERMDDELLTAFHHAMRSGYFCCCTADKFCFAGCRGRKQRLDVRHSAFGICFSIVSRSLLLLSKLTVHRIKPVRALTSRFAGRPKQPGGSCQ